MLFDFKKIHIFSGIKLRHAYINSKLLLNTVGFNKTRMIYTR